MKIAFGELKVPISESLPMSAIPMPIKLGEVSDHLARGRVDRRAVLMSPNGCELDSYIWPKGLEFRTLHFPSLLKFTNAHQFSIFTILAFHKYFGC
ncbi:hypothetical protein H5410_046354 [Solanum commersonii]|uniref:Uncharacterized protein n=1 Tax=Solanum commersonii TaxID=4109 RepID=A0A9J5XG91_SOLCO|nr:hypothetical protein H5410_046354 [Solanum commersonii]